MDTIERPGMDTPSATPADRALMRDLRDLYDEYADCLDADELERWPGFFTDDCTYQIISRENYSERLPHATMYCDGIGMVRDRVLGLRETQVFEPRMLRHFVSGLRAAVDGDGLIHARANFLITEALSDKEPHISLVGQYLDILERRGDRLLFRQRLCVFDNYRIRTSLIVPV